MILLVTEYDNVAWDLHYSLLRKGFKGSVLSLEDNLNQPDDVQSIWSALYKGYDLSDRKPLHINDFPVPLDWEVEREDGKFLIKTIDGVIGEVFMAEPTLHRIVSEVHWFDSKGFTYKKDYYNQFGFLYKSSTFVKCVGLVGSQFYSPSGEMLATWNHQTDSVVVARTIFPTMSKFYLYCLEELGYSEKSISFNNLGTPLQMLIDKAELMGEDMPPNELIFTEKVDELPGNIDYILKHKELNVECYVGGFEGARELANESDDVDFFEFHAPLYISNKFDYCRDVLITTETDDLWSIERLVDACPNNVFHIAAPTLMSSRLTALGDKSNVKLYQQATQGKVEQLLETSGIFLDIANSPTVYDANRLALRYKCLRLGVRGISSGDYISEIYMAYPKDFEWLKDFIDYCSQHADSLDQWVAKENFALGYSYD